MGLSACSRFILQFFPSGSDFFFGVSLMERLDFVGRCRNAAMLVVALMLGALSFSVATLSQYSNASSNNTTSTRSAVNRLEEVELAEVEEEAESVTDQPQVEKRKAKRAVGPRSPTSALRPRKRPERQPRHRRRRMHPQQPLKLWPKRRGTRIGGRWADLRLRFTAADASRNLGRRALRELT